MVFQTLIELYLFIQLVITYCMAIIKVVRLEDCLVATDKHLQEKMQECAHLGGELERTRDEAACALMLAKERNDTIRKCMQIAVTQLKAQLTASRAQVTIVEKDREELEFRMQCQIQRLNEKLQEAQLRILDLQTQVQTLKTTASSVGEGEGDIGEQQDCESNNSFENP